MSTAQQVFATIKRTSKYAYQQAKDKKGKPIPFPVTLRWWSEYKVVGNSNEYRIADVVFYVQVPDTLDQPQFLRLS